MSLQNRRDDTRTKIQLGGLVSKAGIENEGETARRQYRRIGDQTFTAAGHGMQQQEATYGSATAQTA